MSADMDVFGRRPRYESVTSCSVDSDTAADIWEDFAANGRDSDLDDGHVTTLPRPLVSSRSGWPAADGGYGWFNGGVNDIDIPVRVGWGSYNSGAVFTHAPRAITGRHGDGWWLQQGARVTSVDTDTAAVMMNAMRAIHTVRTAPAAANQLNQWQQQQQESSVPRQWMRPPCRSTAAGRTVQQSCVLCKNNGELRSVYESHALKDDRGCVTCPVLFSYVCPYCGATGSTAHTVRYCPVAPAGASVVKSLKTARDSAGHRRIR